MSTSSPLDNARVELWVRDVVERVLSGHRVEDMRVELKSTYHAPSRAARQLAAHANTARGQPILWILGLDEKTRSVRRLSSKDMGDWLNQVGSEFDDLAPTVVNQLAVSIRDAGKCRDLFSILRGCRT